MTLGPHPKPWPSGPEYDVKLLEEGDTRNVVDKYRYWSREAIIADLDQSRHSFHIAIENWEHDFNIGTANMGVPIKMIFLGISKLIFCQDLFLFLKFF